MNHLQSLVFPNLDISAPEQMYVRSNELAWAELGARRLRFCAGGRISTDTFYNALSVGAWKRHCDIRALVLRLQGSGDFLLRFGLHRQGQATVWLSEHEVSLHDGHPSHVPVPVWEVLKDGLLFFSLRSVSGGCITAAAYVTPDAALNPVTLGLVITHFNRQALVAPAIRRIQSAVLSRPDLKGRVTLTVVDNSRNLPVASQAGLQVIPNENYGGSGGFTRGLLELLDSGTHTHALFMDDDASCEPESIARTFAMLQYSREPRLAVAGALLSELEPWRLIEKGAGFDGLCRPLCNGMDMRRLREVLDAETKTAEPDYGGWWFFAFPLREIRRFPFPFFVRGDDVLFSLSNEFRIATLNGVACFGEDFSLKHGPMTAYLDARYHLMHTLMGDERRCTRQLLRLGRRMFFKPLLSYNYASARAFTLAMQHLLAGPQFFRDNLDLQQVRALIASWTPSEKLQPLDRTRLKIRPPKTSRESKPRRLVRVLTLQGFLLPKFLLLDRTTVQSKGFHGSARAVFRYRRVLYEHPHNETGYLAEHDRRLFFSELGAFLRTGLALLRRLPELRQDYRRGFEELASATFWRQLYGKTGVAAPTALSASATPAAPPAPAAPLASVPPAVTAAATAVTAPRSAKAPGEDAPVGSTRAG